MAKKEKVNYYDCFIEQADYAVKQTELLIDVIKKFTTSEELKTQIYKAHEIETAADVVNHRVQRVVMLDFITPFDRDDIIELAHVLDNINDKIEGVIQLFYMYDVHEMAPNVLNFAKIINKECRTLHLLMTKFKNFKKNVKEIYELIVRVNSFEEEADKLYIEVIRNLYVNFKASPMKVLIWTRIFDRLEACCDVCEHAADTVNDVVLQNS